VRSSAPRSRAEQTLRQLLAREFEVNCHVREDAAERTDTKRVVIRDRDVVLAVGGRGDPEMAPGLARDAVAEDLERLRQPAPREVPAGASRGDHFVADEVEADHLRGLPLLEVAAHGVAHLCVQLRKGVGLREDRRPKGAGRVAALGRLLHEENHLAHTLPTLPRAARERHRDAASSNSRPFSSKTTLTTLW